MKLLSGLVTGVLLTVAVPVCAQSLGDLAKKEQERRKTLPPAAKTYTNEDLKKLPPAADSPAKPADKTTAKAGDAAKADEAAKPGDAKGDAAKKDGEPAKDEKYWRGRITTANEDIHRNEMFRDALQSRINALSADFAGRDDPYQRAKIADDRQKALAELARVNQEIDKGNKLIADIADEARRAGVPPGWIR
jgi:hypothetical protein